MKSNLALNAFVLSIATAVPSLALADAVYHSERLPFFASFAEGHPALRAGAIVNIHPNGPVVGAIQRYSIEGAKPNTRYDIFESIFPDCSANAPELLSLPRGVLTTNAQGKGYAEFVISEDELAPYSGLTIGASWTLEAGEVVAYYTRCTIGTID